jgi:hypothetical protein
MMKPFPIRKHERGSAMVEASLTLMLFMIMVFSLFDFGFSLYLHQTFASQARLGVRYGAINPGNLTTIKNMVLYSQTTGSGNGVMGLSPSSVSVTRSGTQGGADDRIGITISGYSFSFLTPCYSGGKTGKAITFTIPVEN